MEISSPCQGTDVPILLPSRTQEIPADDFCPDFASDSYFGKRGFGTDVWRELSWPRTFWKNVVMGDDPSAYADYADYESRDNVLTVSTLQEYTLKISNFDTIHSSLGERGFRTPSLQFLDMLWILYDSCSSDNVIFLSTDLYAKLRDIKYRLKKQKMIEDATLWQNVSLRTPEDSTDLRIIDSFESVYNGLRITLNNHFCETYLEPARSSSYSGYLFRISSKDEGIWFLLKRHLSHYELNKTKNNACSLRLQSIIPSLHNLPFLRSELSKTGQVSHRLISPIINYYKELISSGLISDVSIHDKFQLIKHQCYGKTSYELQQSPTFTDFDITRLPDLVRYINFDHLLPLSIRISWTDAFQASLR